jgi:hypothetical protein
LPETIAASLLAGQIDRLLNACGEAVEGLSLIEVRDSHGDRTNPAGFDVWHVARTVDNVIHFVFERERPVWLTEGFYEAWGLPRVEQGTGMAAEAAYALPYPEAAELRRYAEAVRAAVVPRIAAMTDAYLAEEKRILPWGELPRFQTIVQVLIGHGNGHLGRVELARALWGKSGLGI